MTVSIDADRLWQSIMDIARIGPTPEGGSCRLALSPEDAEARALLLRLVQAAEPALRAGRDRQHVPAPQGQRRHRAGGRLRQPSRHGADRRALRRRVRRARRPRSDPRAGRRRHRDTRAARTGQLDQRGRQPLSPGDDGQPRARRRHDAGGRARHHRRQRHQRARRAARQRPGRPAGAVAARLGLLAGGAYRAGPGHGGDRRRYRHRHRHRARPLFPAHRHRRAEPCRPHHDGPPARQPRRDGRDHPGGGTHRARRRAGGPRLGHLDRELPERARQRRQYHPPALRRAS